MSSSSSNTASGGFGITLHHEGQNAQNSIAPSPLGSTAKSDKQAGKKETNQPESNESIKQGTIDEDDIKNNKP